MSFFGIGEKGGLDCEDNEDGTKTCRKFHAKRGSKIASGSEANIIVDPKSCKAQFVGRYSVLEEDEDDFQRIAKKMEASCRNGIQSQ